MQHLLLLHGAIGSATQLQPLADTLRDKYQVHLLNFSGHGGRAFPEKDFSISLFSEQAKTYMKEQAITQAAIFGYSMGGYVAIYMAKHFPEKITGVITLGTKFHWNEATAVKEASMLDADIIQQKFPEFATQLHNIHAPNDWISLLEKTKQMLTGLGQQNALLPEDYVSITTPALLLLGDRDKMVTLDETLAVYKQLPEAQLGILPNTPHSIEKVSVEMMTTMMDLFFKSIK
jgi:pimeloyl-ACP methyl ester carboxylesterase